MFWIEKAFTVLFGREGELGRILLEEKELSETKNGQSYRNNLNCSNISGEEGGQKKIIYHISCFRCYFCSKILKASRMERAKNF